MTHQFKKTLSDLRSEFLAPEVIDSLEPSVRQRILQLIDELERLKGHDDLEKAVLLMGQLLRLIQVVWPFVDLLK